METTDDALIQQAIYATKKVRRIAKKRQDWGLMGYVGAALLTKQGNVYTGVNLALFCGIGFCAEHSAVAEMIKNGETVIEKMVAVTAEGKIIPPCGRCRELLYQIDESNLKTEVFVESGSKQRLADLLPHNWQKYFDKPLHR